MEAYQELSIDIPDAVLQERRRQIDVEGWSIAHDELHDDDSLLQAAMYYFRHGAGLPLPLHRVAIGYRGRERRLEVDVPIGWPWEVSAWKPKSPRRDLERAGALCLAEIDRRRRHDPGCDVDVVLIVLKDVIKAYVALPAVP